MDIEAGRMDRPPAPRGFLWLGLWLGLWLDRRPCAGGPTPCGVLNRELCTRGLPRELRPNSPAYVRALRENSDVPRAASTRAGATVARLHTSPPLVGISAPDAGLGACFLSIAEKSAGRVRSGRSGLPTSVCLRQFAHVSLPTSVSTSRGGPSVPHERRVEARATKRVGAPVSAPPVNRIRGGRRDSRHFTGDAEARRIRRRRERQGGSAKAAVDRHPLDWFS